MGSLLFLPDSPSDPELELLAIAAGEEEGHVAGDDEAVMAVPHLAVAVSYAAGHPLPDHLPPIRPHFQAVAVVLRLAVVPHEPEERYVHRRHPQLECLKVQAKVLPKAAEDLGQESQRL